MIDERDNEDGEESCDRGEDGRGEGDEREEGSGEGWDGVSTLLCSRGCREEGNILALANTLIAIIHACSPCGNSNSSQPM